MRARPAASRCVSAEPSIDLMVSGAHLQAPGPAADLETMTSLTTRATPEQLYRLLADNATDLITLHDVHGRFLYASPSLMALTGRAPEDVLGLPCWAMIHPADIAGVQRVMHNAVVE